MSSPGSYATGHGFPSYLDMHFALLHPSTHPDVAEYHLRETDMGSARCARPPAGIPQTAGPTMKASGQPPRVGTGDPIF